MSGSKPQIAILLATYNGASYISEQIDSILNQTYTNWKLYIHDDGSKDQTLDIIKEYENKYPDKIQIVDGPGCGGPCKNFMYLFRKVEAELYMCCDQDDVWLPSKIELTYNCFEKIQTDKSMPCLVHTDLKVVDGNLNIVAESMNSYQKLFASDGSINHVVVQNVVTGCTMMVNLALRNKLIKIDVNENVIMHDWWAALIAAQFGKIEFLDQSTIMYRQHGDNSVGAKKLDLNLMMKKFQRSERDAIRKSLSLTQKQAKEFAKVYGLNNKSDIYQYGLLENMNKFSRLKLYITKGFHKSSLFRTFGLYLWG